MRKYLILFIGVTLLVVLISFLLTSESVAAKSLTFNNSFASHELLVEVGDPGLSSNKSWWLNSGARFFVNRGVGQTLKGNLPDYSIWRTRYRQSDSVDTAGGYRPQNIFRLYTRRKWGNFFEQAYFRMRYYDSLNPSSNRNNSNGFTLISRYQDADNFYYGGVRIDGSAVIKKKLRGTYHEMAYLPSFLPGTSSAHSAEIISSGETVGIRLDTVNLPQVGVLLRLYIDLGGGHWQEVLSALDDGTSFGPTFYNLGPAGIRTDFMDAEISSYLAEQIVNP